MISQYEVIQSHISKFKDMLYTASPAEVVGVNTTGDYIESVDVRPTIDRVYTDGSTRAKPIIYNVPVVFPSAGGGILSFPISLGDTVLVIFCKDDIENFLSGSNTVPKTLRKFSYNDAVAIPSFYPTSENLQPSSEDVELKFNGNVLTLKQDGNINITTSDTISINNGSEELISLLSDLVDTLSNTTVSTIYGQSILNSKPDLIALKAKLDTFKE